jgi:mannosyltransferase
MSATEYRAPAPAQRSRLPKLPIGAAISRVPAEVWAVGALTLIAAVLRFDSITAQSYWADEALTVHEVQMPFGAMLSAVSHAETTPPLYFILAWAWAHVFGTGEAALHSLSAVLGVAVVPITYLCARDLVSRRAGVIAAAFAAVSPFLVWYSQEARSYMLLVALTGASFLWFIRSEREPSRRNVLWWAAFSALALVTHFFAGFFVAPEALWLLWRARNRTVLLAAVALAAVQLALLPLASQDSGHGLGWIHAIPRLTRIAQVPTEFAVMTIYRHVSVTEGLWGGAIVIAAAVLLLSLAGGWAERRGAAIAAAIAAIVLVAPLLLGVASPVQDVFLVRNLSPAWIPLAVALAAACAAPRARDLGTAAATILVLVFAIATIEIDGNPVFQRADWRGVARALGPSTEPRAILVVGGHEGDALKIFLHGVKWNQPPPTQRVYVEQIDVVGSIAHVRLRGPDHRNGRALPMLEPTGAVLLGRKWVRNFDVARYELVHPWRFNGLQISARAGRFFRGRAPKQLLVLVAGGVPRTGPAPVAPAPVAPAPIAPAPGARAHHTRVHHAPVHHARAHRGRHRHSRGHHHRALHRPVQPGLIGSGLAPFGNLPLQAVISSGCWTAPKPIVALPSYPCLSARSPP